MRADPRPHALTYVREGRRMPPAPEPRPSTADPLIVVGASAGGVEALSRFVASLPDDLAAPVVIAQHLDPARPSHLADILARQTHLPVRSVEPRAALAPGTIFVVPSNRHVTITDHHVDVHPDVTRRPTPSVDLLLATAAETFGERLIAVILTGSGSDGAAGAHAVKEAGGTVIIQDPETAAFPSMPRSLAPTLVDLSLPISEMGSVLAELLAAPLPTRGAAAPDLQLLLDQLHTRHGINFGAYKSATIIRRLWRRMAVAKTTTIADYMAYLETHSEEEQRLVADFLIKVTRFFRDPVLFARLREQIIPELVTRAHQEERELRLWSAGCATGEEAYSLALLVAEAIADLSDALPVRIFATDLDETALGFARRGIYPASALSEVPAELVERSFSQRDGAFEVQKAVRGLIVFGAHDLAVRPPFPQTDLVLCRNVLIYFTAELQRRALDIFAYSLREDGVLVLGASETTGLASGAFAPIDRRLRIYRRQGPRPVLPPAGLPTARDAIRTRQDPFPRSRSMIERALLQAEEATIAARFQGDRAEELVRRLPFGVAIIDCNYDLEVINGTARELLGIHGVALGQDLIHLAQGIPSSALRAGIDAVVAGEQVHELSPVITTKLATGETTHLRVSCHPDRTNDDGLVETVLILVADVTAHIEAAQASAHAAARAEGEVATLQATVERQTRASRLLLAANRELTDTVDRLREQGHDLHQAAAAAQVAAEEIETLNEELQSSNEELETLHEEAQATVEELNVANDELHARATELEELAGEHAAEQARLSAVLASMGDAVVVVDAAGRVVRTNKAYDALIGTLDSPFVPADAQGWPLPLAETPAYRVARGEAFHLEFTVGETETTRRWFEATGRPLTDSATDAAGVLVIRDITDRTLRRLQDEFLTWAGHELRTPLTTLHGNLQLAERRLNDSADARLRRHLTLANDEARRLGGLIAELVDATRLQTGKLELTLAPLDLGALVAHAVEVAQVLVQEQVLVLESNALSLRVMGDASRLEQVVFNLLTNAVTHATGTERITVRLRRAETMALLEVADEGPGIPAEAMGSIFDRFAQADALQHAGSSGLGLGLFIAREIVSAHGGTIAAASAPGEGAVFTVLLPLIADSAST